MCGILGVIGDYNIDEAVASLNLIRHRGPDFCNHYNTDRIFLGHTRLSIQDLSQSANQPMFSEDGRYVIVFNGEIYNHHEIRNRIKDKYRFVTNGDTETLLYAWIEYGESILKSLNGIFAFAIYDKENKTVVIARDHFGVKPLYYFNDESTFIFSSELKSIAAISKVKKEIYHPALRNYLTFLWSPGTDTPMKGVKKLLPGQLIRLKVEDHIKPEFKTYYDINFNGTYLDCSERELVDMLEKKLMEAIDRQLLSDVPVGFFLSGGLDSSGIVAMVRAMYPDRKLQCFTIKSPDIASSEGMVDDLSYARKVARHLNVDLIEVDAEINITDEFDQMIYALDEPQADAAPLNVSNICRIARQMGYKVLIGGTAGDDVFSGYRRHQALNYDKYLSLLSPLSKPIQFGASFLDTNKPFQRRIKKLTNVIGESKLERHKQYFAWLPKDQVNQLFHPQVREELSHSDVFEYFDHLLQNIPQEKEPLNQMLYWEMKSFLVDHNLNYTDKMSMLHGVEVRVPFLDTELVEFSTHIPVKYKLKGKHTKYILKKVMEKYLPHDVIYRPKTGFGAPVRKWITSDLDDKINMYLSEESVNRRKLFDYNMIQDLIRNNKAGKIDASYSIWALLAIESWNRQFID